MQDRNGFGTLIAVKRWHYVAIGIAVLGGAGYFYVHHGGAGLSNVSSISSNPGDGAIPDLGGTGGRPARMVWRTVSRADEGFRIELPADPKDLQVPAYNEAGSTEPVKMIFASPDADTTFAIAWEDNPPVARVNNRAPDRTLDMARDGMLARTQTTMVNETRGMAAGFPSRDIAARNTGGGVLDARMIYANDRLYTLLALFPSDAARREQDVLRFFNSFAPSRTPGVSLPEASPRGA